LPSFQSFSAPLSVVAAQPAGQRGSTASGGAQTVPSPTDKIVEAYDQFFSGDISKTRRTLRGDRGLKRAIELDPEAADVVSELASVYLQQTFRRGRHG
jgi:hypothetical protein